MDGEEGHAGIMGNAPWENRGWSCVLTVLPSLAEILPIWYDTGRDYADRNGGVEMPKTISIGTQDFAKLRENDYFYIDKTSFIQEWWESGDAVTLITRPRRFGKTLNMSMLDYFFSNKHAGRGDLFEGLEIWK